MEHSAFGSSPLIPEAAAEWLGDCRVRDPQRGVANLSRILSRGISPDLTETLCRQLRATLPLLADPDMALNNLERFFAAVRSPLSLAAFFEREPGALSPLIQIFSSSQYLSDILVRDPESYDYLHVSGGEPLPREELVDELTYEVNALRHDHEVLNALRRFKQRQLLRIAYGDFICNQSVLTVAQQISYVADAVLEAALRTAWVKCVERFGRPQRPGGGTASFFILGMGKLGGTELNYSSDIDLIFVYEDEGVTTGPRCLDNAEFFQHVVREIVRLLTHRTALGAVYRVDRRLSPEGDQGPAAISIPAALHYYDVRGRTWERQAYIKARPVAGDLELGFEFLRRLETWVYGRFLSRADISGIRSLRRRIESRARRDGIQAEDVKNGWGGIRDIEFAIQFLQLLHGCDMPAVRTGNTLEAVARLEEVGLLSHEESFHLQQSYHFLRKLEHRLQIMFDLQTHSLPTDREELRKLAMRMGYPDLKASPADRAFEADYRRFTQRNRRILDHLLQEAFPDDEETAAEVDLVLDPDPPEGVIRDAFSRYRFREPLQAYRNFMSLAEERIPFLSTRRCRHFLASIAPALLSAVSASPDPDATLVTLDKVTDSLGGKGVLWELFRFDPPTLKLFVRLCAYSPFLAELLVSHPGMIDSLMDSLVLDRLPTPEFLERLLQDLCKSAEDIEPILHAFQSDQLLQVGVRDLLGKDDYEAITRVITHVAETCLTEIAAKEYEGLVLRYGQPMLAGAEGADRGAEMIILGMGKFGGLEMSYQSDLDVVFLYEGDGETVPLLGGRYGRGRESTTNQYFFSQWAQRITREVSHLGPYGRLYRIDARLRPTGKSGTLVFPLDEFARYFREGAADLWERQALCKARVVFASPQIRQRVKEVIHEAAFGQPWQPGFGEKIAAMRRRLEETASQEFDIKRGPGGVVDIEFLVQMLQLRHGGECPQIRAASTWEALRRLHAAGLLEDGDYRYLMDSYTFLRTLEGRLRLVSVTASNHLPKDPTELTKLSHLMGTDGPPALLKTVDDYLRENRSLFDRMVGRV